MQPFSRYLQDRQAVKHTVLLVLLLSVIYILQNRVFGIRIKGLAGTYGLPLIVWTLFIAFMLWLPRVRAAAKLRLRPFLCWLAGMCFFISLLGMMLQGFMSGVGQSPYDHSLYGILINILVPGAALVGTEMARSWLVNRHFARRPLLGIPCLAFVFTLMNYSWNKIVNVTTGLAAVKFLGSEFFPALAQNLLATYLAFLGGALPAVIYRGGLLAVERLSPVLPVNSWSSRTLIGILVPVLGIILVRELYSEQSGASSPRRAEEGYLGWTVVSAVSILFIWFVMGTLSYFPRVVITGSMEPAVKIGDVVVLHRLPADRVRSEVGPGDIIMFPRDGMDITHRVVSVREIDGQYFYTTRGDANRSNDSPPTPESKVKGKVVAVIPKAGWPTLFLRGWLK